MATLIQSKQIEGIVTASTIEGDFSVSGSLIVSGSGIFTNDITASGVISANQFVGDGSQLTGVIATATGIVISSGSNVEVVTQLKTPLFGLEGCKDDKIRRSNIKNQRQGVTRTCNRNCEFMESW